MEDILKDINAVVGVTGSFVCSEEGQVLARVLPDVFDVNMLSSIGRTLAQTIAGLETTNRRKVGDMDLVYGGGRLIVKNLGEGCLCILCVRRINVPLLNLTANVAVKRLSERLKEARPVPVPAPRTTTTPAAKAEPSPAAGAEQTSGAEAQEPVRRMTRAEILAATLRGR